MQKIAWLLLKGLLDANMDVDFKHDQITGLNNMQLRLLFQGAN